uniref:Uncharacterized protein n=1 Tax=Rhizophora mucronata TaxID=61149 RepID=A0A2P2N924_RHIMU
MISEGRLLAVLYFLSSIHYYVNKNLHLPIPFPESYLELSLPYIILYKLLGGPSQ